MIKLQVIGHLGKDCAVNLVNGKNVINFSVCHSETFKDGKGEKVTKSTWVECAYWVEKTGIAPYLTKGAQVFCEGMPEVKTYLKNDGTTGVSLTLRIGMVQLLGSGNGGGQAHEDKPNTVTTRAEEKGGYKPVTGPAAKAAEAGEPIDDLPF